MGEKRDLKSAGAQLWCGTCNLDSCMCWDKTMGERVLQMRRDPDRWCRGRGNTLMATELKPLVVAPLMEHSTGAVTAVGGGMSMEYSSNF